MVRFDGLPRISDNLRRAIGEFNSRRNSITEEVERFKADHSEIREWGDPRDFCEMVPFSLDDDEKDYDEFIPDRAPTPHGHLEEKERKEALKRGLMQLSEEHRQVLLLREVSGLSYAEIAAATGLEEGTVKSRIARARISLRNILREDGNFFASPPSNKTKND